MNHASTHQPSEGTSSEGLVLRLERVLDAPRPAVYRALTEPEILARWWGPKGFTAPSLKFDAKVGLGYRIAMSPPEGEPFHLSGAFREVEPPARLGFTFRWDPPHQDDRETLVMLCLEDRGGQTVIRLEQGTFKTRDRRALHEAGWTESFDRLEQVLGGLSADP